MSGFFDTFIVPPAWPSMGATFEEEDGFVGYCHGCATRITGASEPVIRHDCEAWQRFDRERKAYAAKIKSRAS